MSDRCANAQYSVDRQADLFRMAERDHGLTIALISRRTKISESTLRGWRDGTAMPAWALFQLGSEGGIPDDLVSMLGEPFRRSVVTNDADDEGLFDDLAAEAGELVQAVARARHPNGPGGTAIVPQEKAALVVVARRVMAAAGRVLGA